VASFFQYEIASRVNFMKTCWLNFRILIPRTTPGGANLKYVTSDFVRNNFCC
jgi:hypothetical protein